MVLYFHICLSTILFCFNDYFSKCIYLFTHKLCISVYFHICLFIYLLNYTFPHVLFLILFYVDLFIATLISTCLFISKCILFFPHLSIYLSPHLFMYYMYLLIFNCISPFIYLLSILAGMVLHSVLQWWNRKWKNGSALYPH